MSVKIVNLLDVEEKFIPIYQDYQGALGFDFVLFLSFFFYIHTVIYTHMFIWNEQPKSNKNLSIVFTL